MQGLAALVEAEDWRSALDAALRLWRLSRDPSVAHVVDRISARVDRLHPPPARELHAWWIRLGHHYDPVVVATLLDHVAIRLRSSEVSREALTRRWPRSQLVALCHDSVWDCAANWIDRVAAIETWPEDPRLSSLLTGWLTGPVSYVRASLQVRVAQLLAERLARIGDVRPLPRLEAYRSHVRASGDVGTAIERVIQELRNVQPRSAGVEEIREQLDRPTLLEHLWSQAAHDPDGRGVLGDALLARGDTRGELVALQRSPEPRAARRAARLIKVEWERWLGPDLGLVAVRDGSVFRDGMLEVLRAGHHFTPPWAWEAAARHHELLTVHTVRPGVADPGAYARFVTQLSSLRTLEIEGLETLVELETLGAALPLTCLEIRRAARAWPPLQPGRLAELALRVAPGLRRLVLPRELSTPDAVSAFAGSIELVPRS